MLLLSFAFLIVPNFNPFNDQDSMENLKSIPLPGKSRNLLHDGQSGSDLPADTENPYGITVRPSPPWDVPPRTPALHELKLANYKRVIEEEVEEGKSAAENLIYVQIEKSADDSGVPVESNVTYVSTEAEFKPPTKVNTDSSREKVTVKRRHDL